MPQPPPAPDEVPTPPSAEPTAADRLREVDASSPEASEISRILARWLDNWFRIPGTNLKIGLDPIVGLFPGVGDFLTSSAGMVILLEGVRLRVSPFVLARMGINMLINAALNLLPGVGTVGSMFYKSNSRNLELLRRWQAGHAHQVRRSSLYFLLSLLGLLAVIVMIWAALWVVYLWAFKQLWDHFTQPNPA